MVISPYGKSNCSDSKFTGRNGGKPSQINPGMVIDDVWHNEEQDNIGDNRPPL